MAVFEVPVGHIEEAALRNGAAQAAHVVVAPPAVALPVQHQGIVGGNVCLRQGREGEPLRFQLGDGPHMGQQLILGLKAVLGRQLGRAILELGSPEAPVRRVVLPVDPLAAVTESVGKGLHQGGVHAGIGVEGLFNVDDQGLAALFRKRQGNELIPVEHAAGQEPGLACHGQHLLGQLQLVPGLGVVPLGELRLVVLPESLDDRLIVLAQGAELGIRPLGAELIDVVALAGIAPAGEQLQILPIVHIVPPGAHVAHVHIGIAAQKPPRLALGHHGDHRGDALLQAVILDQIQRRILVPFRTGNGIVKDHLPVDAVAHDEASGRLRPGGVEGTAPHKLGTHRVFA